MSRIFEALKKAEEQRAPIGAGDETQPPDFIFPDAGHEGNAEEPAIQILSPPGGALSISRSPQLDELRQRCTRPGWKLDSKGNVFSTRQSFARCAEQFRTLRSRLCRLRGIQPIRSLLITSSVSGEGKTFVALNLAQAIVRQRGQRAILIDADLRASRLHVAMGAPLVPGLADLLRGERSEFSVVQADSQQNLFFIPAGKATSNPAELLANARLKELLDRLAPLFDWIILDGPPLLPVSDASILGELCDGVVFVVRAGSTPYDLAQAAIQELQKKNLLGVVLNQAETQVDYSDYDTYYAGDWDGNGVRNDLPVSLQSRTSRSALH